MALYRMVHPAGWGFLKDGGTPQVVVSRGRWHAQDSDPLQDGGTVQDVGSLKDMVVDLCRTLVLHRMVAFYRTVAP